MATATKTGVTTYATPGDREVVVRRVVDAPRRLVFAAWTDPRHIPQWLLGPEGWTMPVCEIDPRAGGEVALRLAQVGWRRDGDVRHRP